MFKAIQNLYRHGRINEAGVAAAVEKGLISTEQYAEITFLQSQIQQ